MINSVPLHNLESAYSSISTSMITPQKMPQIQSLNFNMQKKSSINSGSKQGNKLKPSTERTHILNETFKEFNEGIEEGSHVLEIHSNQKTDLLQKRKQYAESIREKNKCSMKDQKSKNKKPLHNQTLNLSLSFTPPKDLLQDHNQTQSKLLNSKHKEQPNYLSQIQKEYYSLKKFSTQQKLSNSKVFAQSNMNLRNSLILIDSNNSHNSSRDINCSKLTKMIQNVSVDLGLSHREGNHSERKNVNNKENKPQVSQPGSARKNTSQKYTSYAQIFDKKSSMNALIYSQKSKGTAGNTASRQMGSIKKDRSALKSMMTPEQGLGLNSQLFSVQLDTVVNGFTIEGFCEELQEMSSIKEEFPENETKLSSIIQREDRIEQESVGQPSNQQSEKPHPKTKNQLQIFSQTIHEIVDFSEEYKQIRKQEQKQLMVLAKQNGTFKRELATFRKQNSSLRKELQKAKEYIAELEQKAKSLVDEQAQFLANQQHFIQQSGYSSANSNPVSIPTSSPSFTTNLPPLSADSNLQQILISTQQQLFSLKSTNKALQLKVYMLEKKLSHQQQLNKKKLAMEVHNWRDKYNKLRNQNIKLKNSLHPFNSDLSFSMDVSREE